jgi:hypothetical protein
MTRVEPTFGTPAVSDHEVSNNWGVNGDTPAGFRIYRDPRNMSDYVDVGLNQTAYRWTGLPSGTVMNFSVSCFYQDPYEEKSASFRARTTGAPQPSPPPPPPQPTPPAPPGQARWWGPESLGGGNIGRSFAACSWEKGRIDLFSTGNDRHLLHRSFTDGYGWSADVDLGGTLSSTPTACCWWQNRIDVFYLDANLRVVHRWWDEPAHRFSDEEDMGITGAGAPAATTWRVYRVAHPGPHPIVHDERTDLFVRGQNAQLMHRRYANQQWSDWEDLGGRLMGDPAAVCWARGRVDVFYPGANYYMTHRSQDDGSSWRGEDVIFRGESSGGGAPVSWGANHIDTFYRDAQLQLGHRWWDGQRWNEESLGGPKIGMPTATSWGPGRIDVFCVDESGNLLHRWYA